MDLFVVSLNCERCIHFKTYLEVEEATMENIKTTHLLELLHLDYLTVEVTECGKDVHVVIITDHFSWYAQALVTLSQTAKCTAQALWDKFIVHCGLPKGIFSNQGQNFESDLIAKWCKMAKVQKLHTSPYHSQTDGQSECLIIHQYIHWVPCHQIKSLK